MEEQERMYILELAWEVALFKKPDETRSNEAAFKAWHDLFDKTYKAVMQTALGK
ncbi:MAG: hypothetical protein V3S84_01900 [Dehalococcoidales bacterium]